MKQQIPHNYFTVWMITPSRELAGTRPVDHLTNGTAPLLVALESYQRAVSASIAFARK